MRGPRHGRRLFAIAIGIAGWLLASSPAHAGLTVDALTNDGRIVTLDSAAPGRILAQTTINRSLLGPAESIVAIDYRPLTGQLYGMSDASRVFQISLLGVLTPVGNAFDVPLDGTAWDMDFNPSADRLRIVSNAALNMRFNPVTGTVVDGDPVTGGTQPDTDLSQRRRGAGLHAQ